MSLDLLDYEFMRLALVAAFFTGLAAPAIGTFMVQRRLALLGDGHPIAPSALLAGLKKDGAGGAAGAGLWAAAGRAATRHALTTTATARQRNMEPSRTLDAGAKQAADQGGDAHSHGTPERDTGGADRQGRPTQMPCQRAQRGQ